MQINNSGQKVLGNSPVQSPVPSRISFKMGAGYSGLCLLWPSKPFRRESEISLGTLFIDLLVLGSWHSICYYCSFTFQPLDSSSMSLFLPMQTERLIMASKQVLGRQWRLTHAFQEFQSETKQHCHCEAPGLHQPRDHVSVADFSTMWW